MNFLLGLGAMSKAILGSWYQKDCGYAYSSGRFIPRMVFQIDVALGS